MIGSSSPLNPVIPVLSTLRQKNRSVPFSACADQKAPFQPAGLSHETVTLLRSQATSQRTASADLLLEGGPRLESLPGRDLLGGGGRTRAALL